MIGRSLSQVGQQVLLKEPKNKKVRVVTIPASALKMLKEHRKKWDAFRAHFGDSYQGDYIFCNPDGSPLKLDTVSASVSQKDRLRRSERIAGAAPTFWILNKDSALDERENVTVGRVLRALRKLGIFGTRELAFKAVQ
jgi:hypothetical protein